MYKDLNLTKTKTKPLESVVKFFITLSAFAAILISIAIVFTLLTEAINFFQDPEVTIREYFTATRWTPTFKNPVYGVLPLISSTLYIALIACLISFPLGLFSAIYLSEFASRRTRKVIKPIMEILAGVPTVVFGYFALNWITPNIVQRFIPGSGVFNAISAGIVSIEELVESFTEGYNFSEQQYLKFIETLEEVLAQSSRDLIDLIIHIRADNGELGGYLPEHYEDEQALNEVLSELNIASQDEDGIWSVFKDNIDFKDLFQQSFVNKLIKQIFATGTNEFDTTEGLISAQPKSDFIVVIPGTTS